MKPPVLLLPGLSWAIFLIPPVLFEMLARTARLPLAAAEPFHVSASYHAHLRSMCTMLCAWGILHPLSLRSSPFPCLMTFRHLLWLHLPSGLCGPCSLYMLRAPSLLSRPTWP